MAKPFKLEIYTPKGLYSSFDCTYLSLTTTSGRIGIYSGHLELISAIEIDEMHVELEDGKKEFFALNKGLIHVFKDHVVLIIDTIEHSSEINLERAEQSKKRAEGRLKEKEGIDIVRAEISLKRALTRIKVYSSK